MLSLVALLIQWATEGLPRTWTCVAATAGFPVSSSSIHPPPEPHIKIPGTSFCREAIHRGLFAR